MKIYLFFLVCKTSIREIPKNNLAHWVLEFTEFLSDHYVLKDV